MNQRCAAHFRLAVQTLRAKCGTVVAILARSRHVVCALALPAAPAKTSHAIPAGDAPLRMVTTLDSKVFDACNRCGLKTFGDMDAPRDATLTGFPRA